MKAIQLEEVVDQTLDLLKDQQISTGEKGDSSLWLPSPPPAKVDSLIAELRDNRAKIAEYEQQLARANEEIAAWRGDYQAKMQQVKQYSNLYFPPAYACLASPPASPKKIGEAGGEANAC